MLSQGLGGGPSSACINESAKEMGAEKEKEQKVTHNERFKVLVSLIRTGVGRKKGMLTITCRKV